jgi:hydroxymethylpyrimidine/phosphomethylpyrimidine kinase
MRTALTIAGSDSVAGAGAQADIKAMAALGVHCASVITAVTAQNTREVKAVHQVPAEMVSAQLEAVVSDLDIKAAKTGMLYDPETVRVVADFVEDYDFPLVVDPVMVATVGDDLYRGDYVRSLKRDLIPMCALITPNRDEAEELVGFDIRTEEDAIEACELIGKDGTCVLLKGGHFEGKTVTDYLYLSSGITKIKNPRLKGRSGHGSGCALSAFITANMANGLDLVTSVTEARKMIQKAIETQYAIGKGVPVVNTKITLTKKEDGDMVNVLRDLDAALTKVPRIMPADLIPKEGMNIAYAVKSPKGPEDIAGVDKRIFVRNGTVSKGGSAKFGSAEHLSFVLLEVMKTNPDMRCVAYFAGDSALERDMKTAGFKVLIVKGKMNEGAVATTIRAALDTSSQFPDVIIFRSKFDAVYMFGKGPRDVVNKMDLSM